MFATPARLIKRRRARSIALAAACACCVILLTACVAGTPPPASTAVPAAATQDALPDASPVAVQDPTAPAVLPQLLAEITLSTDAAIVDVAVDREAGRIYASDTARTLYTLDAVTFALLEARADAGGMLTLDPEAGRLYAATGWTYAPTLADARVVVMDTAGGAELARIPGRWVSLDHAGGRIFVGDGLTYATPDDAPGIRILRAADFAPLGEIPQPGMPVYNPARAELLIVAYSVYTADPATQTVTGDLFPHLTEGIPFLFCNGCAWADWVRVFPDDGLIAVNIQGHTAQGSGPIAAPTWLDAATLAPVADAAAPELQAACGSGGTVARPVDGRSYRSRRYARYVVYNNLLVDAADGTRLDVRDGIFAEFINAATGQAYLSDGTVLALPELQPVGTWPGGCLFAADPVTGRLYAADGGALRVIATTGGSGELPPSQAAVLPAAPILEIIPSPAFAQDATLLARSGEDGRLFRSTDGGVTWHWLRGGLPSHPDLTLGARFSPTYAADRTLFAFGFRRDYWGEGVLRSTDGGETWSRQWQGLEHLRVDSLSVSTTLSGTLVLTATAKFAPADGGPSGHSLQRSDDGGAHWRPVAAADWRGDLFGDDADAAGLPVRAAQYDQALEYSRDGANWLPAELALDPDERVRHIVPAPDERDTLYVLTGLNLYRTGDGGRTWAAWADPRLAGRTYADELSAVSVGAVDGGHVLFMGTAAGEFWRLEPSSMAWRDVVDIPARAPTATSVPTATPLPATPAPAPTATATPPLSAQSPPEGRFRPQGIFGELWATDPAVQMILGWALTPDAAAAPVAVQPFERGEMLWRGDTGEIYARYDAMGWQIFPDTFTDDQPASDPQLMPPAGLLQPVRGFGTVWRGQPGVRELLGWAVAPEAGQDALIQEFERGMAIRLGDRTLVLGATLDGTRAWSRR
jgi:photosystem II stability/assembly factor-like uncharacterized protein